MDDSWPIFLAFAAARFVHFLACLLTAGLPLFRLLIEPERAPAPRSYVLLCAAALGLVGISGVAWYAMATIDISGLPIQQALRWNMLRIVWTQTHFGTVWQIRLLLWILAAAGLFATYRSSNPRANWFFALPAVAMSAGLAWTGHAMIGAGSRCHQVSEVLHLVTCCIWPSGLVPLAISIRRSTQNTAGPQRWQYIIRVVSRFSAWSLLSVSVLAATGLINSLCLINSPGAILSNSYGRLLALKGVLFLGIVSLGAWNLLALKPKLEWLGTQSAARGGSSHGPLLPAVYLEILLATAILAIVGAIGLLAQGAPESNTQACCPKYETVSKICLTPAKSDVFSTSPIGSQ